MTTSEPKIDLSGTSRLQLEKDYSKLKEENDTLKNGNGNNDEKTNPTIISKDLDMLLGQLMAGVTDNKKAIDNLDKKIDIITNDITLHHQNEKITANKLASKSSNRAVLLFGALMVLWEQLGAGPFVKELVKQLTGN